MTGTRLGRLRTALAVSAVGVAALATTSTANADVAEYHPDPESRNFATSPGGWAGSSEYTNGLCIAGLTCPAIENSFVASGGQQGAGDGHLRSSMSGLLGLATTARATWQSPSFTYEGVAGEEPDVIELAFDRRTDAGALLQLIEEANYRVFLDDITTGTSLSVMREEITNSANWTSVAAASINPRQLTIGHEYSIRVITELDLPAAVIPSATFDYDNVVMRAITEEDPGGNDIDGDGILDQDDNCVIVDNPGQEDTDGDGIGDACEDTTPPPDPDDTDTDGDGVPDFIDNCDFDPNPQQADADGDGEGDACDPDIISALEAAIVSAKLNRKGTKIKVRVRCAQVVPETCEVRKLVGLKKGRGSKKATKVRKGIRIEPGQIQKVKLKVKGKFREHVRNKDERGKRMFFRGKLAAGEAFAPFYDRERI